MNTGEIYKGNLRETLSAYFQTHHYSQIFIITDAHLLALYYETLVTDIPALQHADFLEVDCGEACKDLNIVSGLWESLHQLHADRNSLIIGLGGGSITDLSGFVASTYMRGLPFIHIPTTLLSQIDAALGGKNGFDFAGIKNLIGTIHFPEALFIDPIFLNSLKLKEIKSGFGEMIKYGLALDESYWNDLKKIKLPQIPFPFIEKAIALKNAIVAQDPTDLQCRHKLNFGHSFGHALEIFSQSSSKPYLHGEAIAIGMIVASYLSIHYCHFPQTDFEQIFQFIQKKYTLPKLSQTQISTLINLMKSDKKNINNTFNFTLLEQIGQSRIHCIVNEEDIRKCLTTLF